MKPFVDSSDIVHDGGALDQRMKRDGYLFIKDLLPREVIAGLRRQFMEIVAEAGWLKPGTAIDDAVVRPEAACTDPDPRCLEVLKRQYVLEDYHAVFHRPEVMGLFERMFGEPVLKHPESLIRVIFPKQYAFENTTGPHQDFPHVQGTTECFTLWVPLGDCPTEMGALAIAAGSHRDGVREFRIASDGGGIQVTDPLIGQWVVSDYEIGDFMIFHSLVVHRALPNLTDRLRQSIDVRYQRLSEPTLEKNLKPYTGICTWEEAYAGWKSKELQYYWKKLDVKTVPWDWQYYEKRAELAFAMAEEGDEEARIVLLRILQQDQDRSRREEAARCLDLLDEKNGVTGSERVAWNEQLDVFAE